MANNFWTTNDPKESKQWRFDIFTCEQRDLGEYDMNILSRRLSSALKSKTKLICFSKDHPDLSGDHVSDIYKRGFCRPRMWAQYANNHTGVCLVFDKQDFDDAVHGQFSNFLVVCGDVKYADRGVFNSLGEGVYWINIDHLEQYGFHKYVSDHFHSYHQRLFFEKLSDWETESEYRWVIAADREDPLFVDYQDSLVGIVFGDSATEENINSVIELTEHRVLYAGLKWNNCSPWYDLANLKYDKPPALVS